MLERRAGCVAPARTSSRRRSRPATPRDRPGTRHGSRMTASRARSVTGVALNRAVAVALSGDLEQGLALIDQLGELGGYHLLHAARADLLRRVGRTEEAADEYRRAIASTANEPELRYLERRLAEVT